MDDQIPDRMELLRAFDDTRAGVKGLSDSGIVKLPRIFVRPQEELSQDEGCNKKSDIQIPIIDLDGVVEVTDRRRQIIEEVRIALETWGFFQVVNHGIPLSVLDGMIDGVRAFNEQEPEIKKEYYTRDPTKPVRYNSSYDLYTAKTASWRDTLTLSFSGTDDDAKDIHREKIPPHCRDSALEYSKHIGIFGNVVLGILSEVLGLKTDHLKDMECSKGHRLHCHYYPACPEPDMAIGTAKHSDAGFLPLCLFYSSFLYPQLSRFHLHPSSMAASLQDAVPVKDVVTEADAAVKEPQMVVPPPPPVAEDPVLTLDVEDEDDVDDLEAPPYHDQKLENFEDDDEEKDLEYSSPFVEGEDAAAAPFRWGAGESAALGDFNDDEDPEFDDDDELVK